MKYLMYGEETERLRYRPLTIDDYDKWIELFDDADAARFVGLGHLSDRDEQCRMWFDRAFLRIENDMGGLNVIADKKTGELIGQTGLLVQVVDEQEHLEVGYSILPRHWRKGYATEAARKCRDHAFEHNYANELISIIHVENHKSAKVAEHNGMTKWKTTDYKGFPVDIYRITRNEWDQLKKA